MHKKPPLFELGKTMFFTLCGFDFWRCYSSGKSRCFRFIVLLLSLNNFAVDPCKWDGRCRRVLPKVEFAWLICKKMIDALKQRTQHRKINNEIGSVKGPTPKDGCFDESRKGNYIKLKQCLQ
ncbi:hypothetical protein L2E82_16905 [Cichorium intybus]|uniref:Uncharacterized protein n=1 Tax=Cichorium intybus TaxID=13427 RepID=A0ACB9F6U5_CICIN|nr:hypothetical protein L2E82_16905 [Cichorium intybus]